MLRKVQTEIENQSYLYYNKPVYELKKKNRNDFFLIHNKILEMYSSQVLGEQNAFYFF